MIHRTQAILIVIALLGTLTASAGLYAEGFLIGAEAILFLLLIRNSHEDGTE